MHRLGVETRSRFALERAAAGGARASSETGSGGPNMEPRPPAPGFSFARLQTLMARAIRDTGLDLSGMTVLTEAANGAYATTATIAAMAGAARVYTFARSSRHGSAAEAASAARALAAFAGVEDRIVHLDALSPDVVATVDIVTNSGHLRPIAADLIDRLPASAVIALMFEAWEFRPADIDLERCFARGIPVVGVNERHPSIDVFSFLGPLSVRQLNDCGLAGYRNRVALLCDNAFSDSLVRGLSAAGADVEAFANVEEVFRDAWDAVVVALLPGDDVRIGEAEARRLAAVVPASAPILQFWGDMDRPALGAQGLAVWPPAEPSKGHMGALLSDVGPEPIVRLQTGGLRAAEWVFRGGAAEPDGYAQLLQPAP